jgi:hypothetical protein
VAPKRRRATMPNNATLSQRKFICSAPMTLENRRGGSRREYSAPRCRRRTCYRSSSSTDVIVTAFRTQASSCTLSSQNKIRSCCRAVMSMPRAASAPFRTALLEPLRVPLLTPLGLMLFREVALKLVVLVAMRPFRGRGRSKSAARTSEYSSRRSSSRPSRRAAQADFSCQGLVTDI